MSKWILFMQQTFSLVLKFKDINNIFIIFINKYNKTIF